MLYVKETTGTIGTVSRRLLSAARARGMRAVGLHVMAWNPNLPETAGRSECRIFDFCNVVLTRRALEASPSVAAALPCRVAVYEEAGVIKVATLKPGSLMQMVGLDPDDRSAAAMDQAILAAIDEACEDNPRSGWLGRAILAGAIS